MSSQFTSWIQESKESLSIAGPICNEANELLSTARGQIERASVCWAQTVYLHTMISSQFQILQGIVDASVQSEKQYIKNFEKSLSLLDEQDHALQLALKDLDVCQLDPAIQLDTVRAIEGTENTMSSDQHNSARTLRSFVDEDGVARLKKSITDAIDQVQMAQEELREETRKLSDIIGSLQKESIDSSSVCTRDKLEQAHVQTNLIATDAHEMAMLLESLARHYDQCTQAYDLSLEVMRGKYSADISEELEELTEVLNNDARELDGVLTELYERRESIANSAEYVVGFLKRVESDHSFAIAFFQKLDSFGLTELAQYEVKMTELGENQSIHSDQVLSIFLPEMSSLVDYYRIFLRSYHSMVLEISRRKNFQTKLQTLADEMQRKVDKTIDEELMLRQQFLEECGNYLPGDLWPGLLDPPPIIEVISNKDSKLPKISSASITAARHILRKN